MATFEEDRQFLPQPIVLTPPKLAPRSLERWIDVEDLASKEFNFLSFAADKITDQTSNLQIYFRWVRGLWNQVRKLAQRGATSRLLSDADLFRTEISEQLSFVNSGFVVLSDSPRIAGIAAIENPETRVALIVSVAIGQSPNRGGAQIGLGPQFCESALLSAGAALATEGVAAVLAVVDRLESARAEWTKRFSEAFATGMHNVASKEAELQTSFQQIRDTAYNHQKDLEKELSRLQDQVTQGITAVAVDVNALRKSVEENCTQSELDSSALQARIKSAESELDSETAKLRDAYEVRMQLQVPAKYWADKAARHKAAFKRWMAAFVIGAGLVFVGAVVLQGLLNHFLMGTPTDLAVTSKVAANVFFALSAVWVLRFISRVLTDNLRLLHDCEHRQMLVQTFVAMIGEGKLKNEEPERLAMLQAILRPIAETPEGDTPPTVISELLRGIGKG